MKSLLLLVFLSLIFSVSSSSSSSFSILNNVPEKFVDCLYLYSNNATSISEITYTSSNSSFESVWQFSINAPQLTLPSNPRPLVIVTPVEESQVRTVLYCAKKQGLEVRIRCGGHDFEGLSYTNPTPLAFVMIDMIRMRSIDIDVNGRTAWVQGGATLGELYYRISQASPTLGFPGGTWSSVGVGGLIGGGGYGFLMRKYGLAVDYVIDARLMDVNGRILTRKLMGEDLFWAIRGGVASSFGVILAWKLRLVPVPETLTVFIISKTLEEGATNLLHKWQYVAPTIDNDLLIRVQIESQYINGSGGKKTVMVLFEGFYLGRIDTLLPLMEKRFPELGVSRNDCTEMSYVQSVLLFSSFSSLENPEILLNRSATPRIGGESKSDFVRTPIPLKAFDGIWEMLFKNDVSDNFVLNPYGGMMNEFPESEVPFPNRAGTSFMMLERVRYTGNDPSTDINSRRFQWIRDFHNYIKPYVSSSPRRAYVNYNDLDVGVGSGSYEEASVWGRSYFNNNFKRLVQVKTKVDPMNFFRHPQSIPPFPNLYSDM